MKSTLTLAGKDVGCIQSGSHIVMKSSTLANNNRLATTVQHLTTSVHKNGPDTIMVTSIIDQTGESLKTESLHTSSKIIV